MAQQNTITILAPDGTPGDVPAENVPAALAAGGKIGVQVYAPDGTPGYVPHDRVGEAIAKGASYSPDGQTTISAPVNNENPITNYFHDLGNDLTQGGSRTGIGRALGAMQGRQNGYSGLNSGVSEGAANIMGSPLTGTAQALEGLASIPQHPIAGPVKAVGGIAKALTIPGLMATGGGGAAAAVDAIPSAAYAGQRLNNIAEAVGNADVPLNRSLAPLQRLAELNQNGGSGSVPAGVMQLLERSQAIAPMGYPTARDFASNISALSGAEKLTSKPQVLAQMGVLRSGLHGDIADSLGVLGPEYLDAIKEYARAQSLKTVATKAGKYIGGGAVGAVIGNKAYNMIKGVGGK